MSEKPKIHPRSNRDCQQYPPFYKLLLLASRQPSARPPGSDWKLTLLRHIVDEANASQSHYLGVRQPPVRRTDANRLFFFAVSNDYRTIQRVPDLLPGGKPSRWKGNKARRRVCAILQASQVLQSELCKVHLRHIEHGLYLGTDPRTDEERFSQASFKESVRRDRKKGYIKPVQVW